MLDPSSLVRRTRWLDLLAEPWRIRQPGGFEWGEGQTARNEPAYQYGNKEHERRTALLSRRCLHYYVASLIPGTNG